MTPDQWKKLTPSHQGELWSQLSAEDRAAIIQSDSTAIRTVAAELAHNPANDPKPLLNLVERPAQRKLVPFTAPTLCGILSLLGLVSFMGGIFLIVTTQMLAGIVCIASSISMFAWAQMLEHIAQTAHFVKQTAELLARADR